MTGEPPFPCDISVVVTAHAEGRLAHRTMRSIQAAVVEAEKSGLRTEIIVVLDSPTPETLDYFARWRKAAQVLDVSTRDPGLNRNAGAEAARGKYIAIIDADDLMGKNWLRLAFQRAEQVSLEDFIIHAEYTIFFENWNAVAHHQPSDAAGYRKLDLLTTCIWTSIMFAPRATFHKVPFQATPARTGFGYEDWHWMCSVLAVGGEVLIAEGSCKFTRYKISGSQLTSYDSRQALIRPCALFDPRRNSSYSSQSSAGNGLGNSAIAESQITSTPVTANRDGNSRYSSRGSQGERVRTVLTKTFHRVSEKLGLKHDEHVVLPEWLIKELRQISKIEPALFPSRELLTGMEEYRPEAGRVVEPYACLCNELGKYHRDAIGPQFTHVYLVPGLKGGRADLDALDRVQDAAQQSSSRVLVIATEGSDAAWGDSLPKSVTFLDFGKWSSHLNSEQRRKLLALLLVQCQPEVIHNIDSETGHLAFTTYGLALSQGSRLYSEAFGDDIPAENKDIGFGLMSIANQAEYLSAIGADNERVPNYLEETFGIDPKKLSLHRQQSSVINQ